MKTMASDGKEVGQQRVEVTVLSSRDRPAGQSILQDLEKHWRELKAASEHLPRREDVDTARVAGALPHAFIIERAAPGVARVRIAGRRITSLFGCEPKGLPLSVLFTPAARGGLQHWIERCFAGPALVDMMVEASQGALRQPLRGRLLLLPMLDHEGCVTRALGGLLIERVAQRRSLRFDLPDAVPRVETILTPAPRRALAEANGWPKPGFREAERPYLRLVVSNSRR